MIPLNDDVKVYKVDKTDSWGISQVNTEPTKFKCMITEVTDLIELKTISGKTVQVAGEAVIKGKADISIGDKLATTISTDQKEVLKVQFIKDLSATILFTKVVF